MLPVALPLTILFLLSVRTTYLVNYVNYDYTTEFVGYAHGAPGVKWALEEIEQTAQRTGQGTALKVAYDSEVSWPMTWYLRNYAGFFGDTPNRAAVDGAAVVVVGAKNWQNVERYLGGDYSRYEVIRMWWPNESYRDLNWERLRGAVSDPQMRSAIWNIIWARDYALYGQLTVQELNPPAKWSPENRMRIYIRKDLAGQSRNMAFRSSQLPDLETKEDTYTAKRIQVAPLSVIKPEGVHQPRNIAAAPDGTFLLADSGNSRIIRIDSHGRILHTWGTRTAQGAQLAGPLEAPGTFNEPWGLAVDPDGNVYVADTWNHRIQKFDQNGSFLTAWGTGGLSVEGTDRFWGPRGVAVAGDGKLYVTDTGNRRVAVFDPDGTFLFDFENQGEAQLDEPVGIAIGIDNRVYVADTWNRRIAVFTLDGTFERAWPVQAWESVSIDNKPYLAVSEQGLVYLTDPEGFRILVFSSQGEILAEFGEFGEAEDNAFALPVGVAVGQGDQIWIVDAGTNRVVTYPFVTTP
jgi:sugar lactone lactonase YvrE